MENWPVPNEEGCSSYYREQRKKEKDGERGQTRERTESQTLYQDSPHDSHLPELIKLLKGLGEWSE